MPNKQEVVTLALPKVTFTSPSFSLARALKGLGMMPAFDPAGAHFEGMYEAPLHVDDVMQKPTGARLMLGHIEDPR